MTLEFLQAKNGEKTFCINKVFFHSSYAPSKEAERFIQSQDFPYTPEIIFIIEPGYPYLYKLLKEKYQNAKIVCIRLIKEFEENSEWDFTLQYTSQNDFEQILCNNFDESKLLKSIMFTWTPAATVFKKENTEIWAIYKKCLDRAKTMLVTRQYFEKKWLYNSCRFFSFLQNPCTLKTKTNFPVVITASGPSLKSSLAVLKKNKDKIIIMSASSSLSVLIANKIIPDIVITTDGGFWAAEHLKLLVKKYNQIPIAVTSEAFVQTQILFKNPVIPLRYKDGISDSFFELCNIPYMTAQRNGTVSGTALNFAEEITNNEIYFCGLDLSIANGFQHTQPNEIELNNCLKDYRINNIYTRTTKSEFSVQKNTESSSLAIYLNWFCNYNFKNKTYRVINNSKNKINGLTDISADEFETLLKDKKIINKTEIIQKKDENSEILINQNKKKILDFINKNCDSKEWKEQLFPIDYVSLSHAENIDIRNKLEEKNNKLVEKLRNLLNE